VNGGDLLDGSGTPFEHMRVALGAFRSMGEPFSSAWVRAIATLPRGSDDRAETLQLLDWGQAAWQAAYEDGDYELIARPAGDWDDEPDADATILAFVAAAVGASDGADPAGVRSIADPPESPSAARSEPQQGSTIPA